MRDAVAWRTIFKSRCVCCVCVVCLWAYQCVKVCMQYVCMHVYVCMFMYSMLCGVVFDIVWFGLLDMSA